MVSISTVEVEAALGVAVAVAVFEVDIDIDIEIEFEVDVEDDLLDFEVEEESEGEGDDTRLRMPWRSCPNRCVNVCGAVEPLPAPPVEDPEVPPVSDVELNRLVALAVGLGRLAVAFLTDSTCASIVIWNRGHRSMLVALMYPSAAGQRRRCNSKACCWVIRTHNNRPKQS